MSRTNLEYRTNPSAIDGGATEPRPLRWDGPLPKGLRVAAYAAAALFAILCVASVAYAAIHLTELPNSVVREQDPKLFATHFYPQLKASRIALLSFFAVLGLVSVARWDHTVNLMRAAWLAVAHPMNLAIYRIALFATILFNLDNDNGLTQIRLFAGLPKELFVPPTGMEHLLRQHWFVSLITPPIAVAAYWTMNAFCITGILGLFSRTSALIVLVCGVFASGIPQLFGQTNHYHHMFWFMSILVVSRCGDHLAIDAIFAARRRATQTGVTAPPEASWGYALPLRFIWVLLSFCYFFPGLWKYWASGLAWAFSDHFKHLAEWKWINLGLTMEDGKWQGEWHPLFRIDKYPLMYMPAAMTALVFEIGFPIAIYFPRLRYLAIAMGVGFHRMIALTMHIPFFTLQTSYVSLVDWAMVLGWVGRKRTAAITFEYDGTNPSARRSVATLRALDLLGNVEFRDDAPAEVGARTTIKGSTLTGAAALRALAARNPVLWAFWPLVYLLPDPAAKREAATAVGTFATKAPRVAPIFAMAALVITPNLYLGAKAQYHGWPFACYPLFEKMRAHVKPDFDVVALDAAGKAIPWDEHGLMEELTRPRYATMCRRTREKQEPKQMQAFWQVLVDHNAVLKEAKTVQFYIRTRYSAPELFSTAPPVKDELVYQALVTPQGVVTDPSFTPPPSAKAKKKAGDEDDDGE